LQHEDCLSDIDAAIQIDPSVAKSAKVMLRKAKCHKKLGEDEEFKSAVKGLHEAILLIQDVKDRGMNKNSINV
jgi:hypothetical protein